jgi:hypothetical protein
VPSQSRCKGCGRGQKAETSQIRWYRKRSQAMYTVILCWECSHSLEDIIRDAASGETHSLWDPIPEVLTNVPK